jgi:hypothetical protein
MRLYPEISNACEPFSVSVVYLDTVFLDTDPIIPSGEKIRIGSVGVGRIPSEKRSRRWKEVEAGLGR